ncbi:unnamed protein product [Periconia digitata]|uniref:Uncharacterized protein n=1 Tax=Periconia digitata TaxID=1303443 RepID=A0A9W4U5K7_9PLEO|nr:unnamed protein product [Periconia digitata]
MDPGRIPKPINDEAVKEGQELIKHFQFLQALFNTLAAAQYSRSGVKYNFLEADQITSLQQILDDIRQLKVSIKAFWKLPDEGRPATVEQATNNPYWRSLFFLNLLLGFYKDRGAPDLHMLTKAAIATDRNNKAGFRAMALLQCCVRTIHFVLEEVSGEDWEKLKILVWGDADIVAENRVPN